MIDRKALGLSFFFSGSLICCAVAILKAWWLREKLGGCLAHGIFESAVGDGGGAALTNLG
jgi:hypothetical protein